MKIKYLSLLAIALCSQAIAAPTDLDSAREQVVKQYIYDLQTADYKDIASLFEKDGTVISTSRGNVNAKDFFYGFLPEITSASTELHQSFASKQDNNRYAARFHFSFTLKDGETGEGEYVDEFIFTDNSAKLAHVYMFENLKFHEQ